MPGGDVAGGEPAGAGDEGLPGVTGDAGPALGWARPAPVPVVITVAASLPPPGPT